MESPCHNYIEHRHTKLYSLIFFDSLNTNVFQVTAVLRGLQRDDDQLQAEDQEHLHPERGPPELDDDKIQELLIRIHFRPGNDVAEKIVQLWLLRDEGIISWPARNILTISLAPQRSGYPFLIEKNLECN